MAKETNTLIDMHNRITAGQLENVLRMQLRTLAEHPELAHVLPPLMVWGAPGLGKSSIIRGIADEMGIRFIDVRLAQREPVDVRGLPVPDRENRKVDWMVSGEWPREGRGILLFDELTAADRSLQVAAYELILDRRLGDLYKVPDGWYICAAGNRVEDAAVSTTMSSALANRFMHVELGEDVESWAHWATLHGIHPSIIGFLRFRPECLFRQSDENLERGWPTPRAWERVSIMMGIVPEEDEELLRKLVYGLVGNRAGMEFIEYHRLNASFADVRRMMLNQSEPVAIPQKVDRKYAMCAAMAYYVWQDLYLPSMRDEALKAVVALDTSGSTVGDLPVFFGELVSLMKSFGKFDLDVIQCDAKVQDAEHYSEANVPPPGKKWKVRGFGGTDFRPVFDYIGKNMREQPDLLLFFTDGYGDAPKQRPPYPVMWVLTKDGRQPADWGRVTHFRKED